MLPFAEKSGSPLFLSKRDFHKTTIFSLPVNNNLLLAECEVRTASYGPSFFPSFYGNENKEGKNEDP